MNKYINSFLRHQLSLLGGSLIGAGIVEAQLMTLADALTPIISGVLLAVGGQVLSWLKVKFLDAHIEKIIFARFYKSGELDKK